MSPASGDPATHSGASPDGARLVERFQATIARAGGDAAAARAAGERLIAAWSGTDRRYHDLRHLAACLSALDDAAPALPAARDARVELALWYHDAIYLPRAKDSEERSALLAHEDLTALGVAEPLAADVARLVRATAHLSRPAGAAELAPDEAVVVDIDLCILGGNADRFQAFERGVREEYASVPAPLFYYYRRRFLRSLVAAPRIFHTDLYRERYEGAARQNLAALLATPRYQTWFGAFWPESQA